MAELLIKLGADVNLGNNLLIRPLMEAANQNHLELAKLLLANGAHVNA